MNYNIYNFLDSLKSEETLDESQKRFLKKTLLIDLNFSQYIEIYKKHGILDLITSDLLLKKASNEQVIMILSLSLPVKEEYFPLITFLVLKNYNNLLKELYIFLTKISESGLRLVIKDVLFESKYFNLLCKLMKNNLRFVTFVIESKKYDKEILSIFSDATDPEVIFKISHITHIISNSDELVYKILKNPYSPDETITLMKQVLIDKKAKEIKEESIKENEDISSKDLSDTEVSLTKEIAKVIESRIDKEINESLYSRIGKMSVSEKIKLSLKGNKTARMLLIKDPNRQVSINVLSNPKITESEIEFILKNRSTGEHIIREIARKPIYVKDYNILKELVFHPKTPLNISMTLINRLRNNDLEYLSKSRDVPSSLKNQAIRLHNTRSNKK